MFRRSVVAMAAVTMFGVFAKRTAGQPTRETAAPDSASPISPPPVPHEFRGVWIATASNIDWPSAPGLGTAQQKAELTAIIDRAAALHLNAVIFQVRPAADALYESKLEPWSAVLTGRMGRAPDPLWDPLAFAVREAHAHGMELHAWFSPFRAWYRGEPGPIAPNHVSRTDPSIVRRYGPYLWMDPGSAAARRHTIRVILDVVRRYDVDGIQVDDAFYPYPVTSHGQDVPFPDDATYRAYRAGGGTLDRDDWRRRNVDLFVRDLYAAVKRVKPWVKVGVSPFGIWRPGNPPSVSGFDAYDELFTDSRLWLQQGWVDYLAPQLYWSTDRPRQSYADLLAWWVGQNVKDRNLWVGNYAARVAGTAGRDEVWPASQLIDQIRLARTEPGVTGDILFSMNALMSDPDSLDERLVAGPYAEAVLVPPSPWLSHAPPVRPIAVMGPVVAGDAPVVRFAPGKGTTPSQWVVQTRSNGRWTTVILPGSARTYSLPSGDALPDAVSVIAVDRVGVESPPAIIEPPAHR